MPGAGNWAMRRARPGTLLLRRRRSRCTLLLHTAAPAAPVPAPPQPPHGILYIRASELAGIAGLHRYVTRDEAVTAFLQRNPTLAATTGRAVNRAYDSRTEAALHQLTAPLLAELAIEAGLAESASPTAVAARLLGGAVAESVSAASEGRSQAVLQRLAAERPALAMVAPSLEADASMRRGVAQEGGSLDVAAAALGGAITGRNERLYKRVLLRHRGYDICVRGKVDGLSEDGRIVETKNRRNRLFNAIPQYERVQLCCYMWLLEDSPPEPDAPVDGAGLLGGAGCAVAVHIESFDGQQVRTEYAWDAVLWAQCRDNVRGFLDEVLPL